MTLRILTLIVISLVNCLHKILVLIHLDVLTYLNVLRHLEEDGWRLRWNLKEYFSRGYEDNIQKHFLYYCVNVFALLTQ